MRKIIAVWAIALLFTGSLFGGELIWEKDTATAFAKAKAEKKNVMLMVEAIHCRWCKKMKQETLSDKEVQKRLQSYILVKILRSDEEAMKILPESYYPAPTTFFMTSDGEIIEKAIGYFEAEDFITYINDVEAN
jgi:thioredoxin-related protein